MIPKTDPYDCHGGPGTTEPACGACITCLHRVIERLTAAGDAVIDEIRYQRDWSGTQMGNLIYRWDEANGGKP